MATNSAVAIRPKSRLPKPSHMTVNDDTWDILTTSTFPTAQDPNAIALVWSLCQVRKLDIFRKPYHIVAMWNSAANRMVEQVIPGINELLVTAVRTGEFCGVDPPVYGKIVTETFHGRRKVRGNRDAWEDAEATVTYPETVSITVWRMVKGQRCAFCMPVRWREEYQRIGGSALPNEMWSRRVFDQCQKVALAASLRVAFSDVVEPEQEDISIAQPRPGEAEVIEHESGQRPMPPVRGLPEAEPPKAEAPHDPVTGEVGPHAIDFVDDEESWQQWGARMIAAIETTETEADLDKWIELNTAKMQTFKTEAAQMYTRLDARINKHRNKLKMTAAPAPPKEEPKKEEGNGNATA